MLYLLVFAAVLGGLGYLAYKRSKDETRIYAKLAAICLFTLSVWYAYQFVYYAQVGNDLGKFYNAGAGVTYTSSTNSTVFYSSTDVAIGEYLAMQRANTAFITIISGIVPYLAMLLGGYLLWYYVEVALFAREKDGVGGVT